jgi:hypothetical protein
MIFPQITEPTGILAFLPANVPSVFNSAIVPGEFESRAVMVSASQYNRLLTDDIATQPTNIVPRSTSRLFPP